MSICETFGEFPLLENWSKVYDLYQALIRSQNGNAQTPVQSCQVETLALPEQIVQPALRIPPNNISYDHVQVLEVSTEPHQSTPSKAGAGFDREVEIDKKSIKGERSTPYATQLTSKKEFRLSQVASEATKQNANPCLKPGLASEKCFDGRSCNVPTVVFVCKQIHSNRN